MIGVAEDLKLSLKRRFVSLTVFAFGSKGTCASRLRIIQTDWLVLARELPVAFYSSKSSCGPSRCGCLVHALRRGQASVLAGLPSYFLFHFLGDSRTGSDVRGSGGEELGVFIESRVLGAALRTAANVGDGWGGESPAVHSEVRGGTEGRWDAVDFVSEQSSRSTKLRSLGR